MKTRTMIFSACTTALLTLGVTIATAAYSQPPGGFGGRHHRGPGHHGGGPMALLRGLDLSDAQKAQVESLVEAQEQSSDEQGQALHEARKGLHQLILSGTYSDAGAAPFVQQIATASGELARLHAKLGGEIYTLLTPEQRTEIAERMAEHEEKGGRGWHH